MSKRLIESSNFKETRKLGITEQLVKKILENPDSYHDALRERFVAVSWNNNTVVIYEKTNDNLILITLIIGNSLIPQIPKGLH